MSEGLAFKSFVSETELEEKRKQRQEEWDKVRTADQPEECPEEEYDPRTLYEKLQEQKDRKQAEYDEQHQFKNMVRGLDEDESKFLDEVAVRQMELEHEKRKEEREIMKEVEAYKDRVLTTEESAPTTKITQDKKKTIDSGTSKKKSQAALLAGAVKRKKSTDTTEESDAKKPKINPDASDTSTSTTANTASPEVSLSESATSSVKNGAAEERTEDQKPSIAQVVAVLPGLGHYANSDISDTSESSDSDLDLMGPLVRGSTKKKKVHLQNH